MRWLGVVLLSIASVLVGWWLGQRSVVTQLSRSSTPPSARLDALPAATPNDISHSTSAVEPARSIPVDSAPAKSPDLDPIAALSAIPDRLNWLARSANGGDPRALVELAEWMDFCDQSGARMPTIQVSDPALDHMLKSLPSACRQVLADHAWLDEIYRTAGQQQLDFAKAMASATPDERTRLAKQRPMSVAQLLRDRAANDGDLVADVLNGGTRFAARCLPSAWPQNAADPVFEQIRDCRADQIDSTLHALLGTGDPRSIEAMTVVASNMFFPGSPYFPQDAREREALWTLTACAFGLDCGPTNRQLRWACLRGVCGYRDYSSYVADRLLPPAQLRSIQQRVPELVALIRSRNFRALVPYRTGPVATPSPR